MRAASAILRHVSEQRAAHWSSGNIACSVFAIDVAVFHHTIVVSRKCRLRIICIGVDEVAVQPDDEIL